MHKLLEIILTVYLNIIRKDMLEYTISMYIQLDFIPY